MVIIPFKKKIKYKFINRVTSTSTINFLFFLESIYFKISLKDKNKIRSKLNKSQATLIE